MIRLAARLLLVATIVAGGCAPLPSPVPPSSSSLAASPFEPSGTAGTPVESGQAWTFVGMAGPGAVTEIRAVAPVGRGFVAVGASGGAGEIAVAWSTADGATWTREALPSRGTSPGTLLPWDDRLLAIGGGSSNRCAHPGEMDTWVRRPDTTWLEAPFQRDFCVGGGLTPVLQGTHAWIIGDGFGEVPTALDSPDGLTWTDRSAALGDIQILAAGTDETALWISGRAGDTGLPEVRTSPDGRHWAAVDVASIGLTDAPGLLALPSGIALLATTDRGLALATRAGAGWQLDRLRGLDGLALRRIHPAGDGLVAIADRDDGSSVLLASVDGAAWVPIQPPLEAGPAPIFDDVAIGRGLVVLAGQVPGATSDEPGAGAVWTAPLSILAP